MVINLNDTTSQSEIGKIFVRSFETAELAESFVRSTYDVVCFEWDKDYPNCADVFTFDGRLFTIEPEGFTL